MTREETRAAAQWVYRQAYDTDTNFTFEHLLTQAVLDAPLFGVRWRWNAGVSLALPRYAGGRKVAPQIVAAVVVQPDQRLVEDLLMEAIREALEELSR